MIPAIENLQIGATVVLSTVAGNYLYRAIERARGRRAIRRGHAEAEKHVRANRPKIVKIGTLEGEQQELVGWEFDFASCAYPTPPVFCCTDGTILTWGYTPAELRQMAANPGEWS